MVAHLPDQIKLALNETVYQARPCGSWYASTVASKVWPLTIWYARSCHRGYHIQYPSMAFRSGFGTQDGDCRRAAVTLVCWHAVFLEGLPKGVYLNVNIPQCAYCAWVALSVQADGRYVVNI